MPKKLEQSFDLVGNLHIPHKSKNEKLLKDLFNSIECDSYAITRENTEKENSDHYHFLLLDALITKDTLRRKLNENFMEKMVKYYKIRKKEELENLTEEQKQEKINKAKPTNLNVKYPAAKKPELTIEEEIKIQIAYIFKDIEKQEWKPITKNLTELQCKEYKEEYYRLTKLKTDLAKTKKCQKEKQRRELIPQMISLVEEKTKYIGADGKEKIRKPTLIEIIDIVVEYYVEKKMTINPNQNQNLCLTILLHFDKNEKQNYKDFLEKRIKEQLN